MRKINKILLKEFANEAAGLGKKEGTCIKNIHKYLTCSSLSLKFPKMKQKNPLSAYLHNHSQIYSYLTPPYFTSFHHIQKKKNRYNYKILLLLF